MTADDPIRGHDQSGQRSPRRAVRLLGRPARRLPLARRRSASTASRCSRRGRRGRHRSSCAGCSTTTAWPSPQSGTGAGWVRHRLTLCLPDAAPARKARDFIRSIIDFAGRFRAPAIIGSMQGRHGDGVDARDRDAAISPRPSRTSANMRSSTAFRCSSSRSIATRRTWSTRVDGGVTLLRSLSTKNVLLLADLFHMNIEESGHRGGASARAEATDRPRPLRRLQPPPRRTGPHRLCADRCRRCGRSATTASRPPRRCRTPTPRARRGRPSLRSAASFPPPWRRVDAARGRRLDGQDSCSSTVSSTPKINEVLGRAGHHAKILIADGNYPASSKRGPNAELICLNLMPGVVTCTQVLEAVISAVPVDAVNTMMYTTDKNDPYASTPTRRSGTSIAPSCARRAAT